MDRRKKSRQFYIFAKKVIAFVIRALKWLNIQIHPANAELIGKAYDKLLPPSEVAKQEESTDE